MNVADCLELRVEVGPSVIHFRATDNGRGASQTAPGNGLTGTRERLEALGGTLEVISTPGEGFSLVGALARTDSRDQ